MLVLLLLTALDERIGVLAQVDDERGDPSALTALERTALEAALADLPQVIRDVAEERVSGIYLVDELPVSGFTRAGKDGRITIVLRRNVVPLRANAWASEKEQSVFSGAKVSVTLRDAKDDQPGTALAYIVLHELGHVLTGFAQEPSAQSFAESAFGRLSWLPVPGGWAGQATLRKEVDPGFGFSFYGRGARVAPAKAKALYAAVDKGCFASLYGMVGPGEDFAEAMTLYVHTKLKHRPYAVTAAGSRSARR